MVHVFSAIASLALAVSGFAAIAVMIAGRLDQVTDALLCRSVDAPRHTDRTVRVRMRPAAYRVMAQLPEARRAA